MPITIDIALSGRPGVPVGQLFSFHTAMVPPRWRARIILQYPNMELRMRKSLLLLMSCLILAACDKTPPASSEKPVDVLLIGAGTMSATLGSML